MKPDTSHFDRPKPIAFERFHERRSGGRTARADLRSPHRLHPRAVRGASEGRPLDGHVRATYPEIRIETSSFAKVDSRLSYGHVSGPGVYAATVTQPRAVPAYLTEQIRLLIRNHGVAGRDRPVGVCRSRCISRFRSGVHVEGEVARPDRPAASRYVRRARSRGDGRRHRQRHLRAAAGRRRCRWRRSPRRASTIRCTACRTTPRRSRSISRTS